MSDNYVTKMSKSGGGTYNVMDKEARQAVTDEATARAAAISAEATERQGQISKASNLAFFGMRMIETNNIEIVTGSAWDDSSTNPQIVNISNYKRSRSIIPYIKGARFMTNASGNLQFIYYNENMEMEGNTNSYEGIPATAEYFVFTATQSVSVSNASYEWALNDEYRKQNDLRFSKINIDIITGSAWDDNTEYPLIQTLSNYKRCRFIIPYNKDAKFAISATGAVRYIYYDENMEKAGTASSYEGIPSSAVYFVFYTTPSYQINSASYEYFLPGKYEDKIASFESSLNEDDRRFNTNEIELIANQAWDDSSEYPNVSGATGYTRCKNPIVYNANAVFRHNSIGENHLYFIYYNENKQKMGTAYAYESIPENAWYFVFYAASGVQLTKAEYIYYLQASNVLHDVSVGGVYAEKSGGVAIIPAASANENGYMSAEDKQKLDNIVNPGTIEITGSGVTKNASAYGFLPTNDGVTNAENLQTALNALGGGTVLIDYPGTYEVSRTILVPSNTEIICGEKVYIKRTADDQHVFGRFVFLNAGAINNTYNENITLKGLKILPNGDLAGTPGNEMDIETPQIGLRGLVVMSRIKNLVIEDFEVVDYEYIQYTIHITMFKNVTIQNVHIETLKDGIHFGSGDGFVIRHGRFLTNDDPIAINAVDYPASNFGFGDIKNGIIEDIRLLAPSDSSQYSVTRGILLLSGAWKNWTSGASYQVYGDMCRNNGILYQTFSPQGPSENTAVSTIAPTHQSGSRTYSDGITWLVKQPENAGLKAEIKNIVFRDVYVERRVTSLFQISSEKNQYMRAVYPGSAIGVNSHISFENVQFLYTGTDKADCLISTQNPIDNILVSGSDLDHIFDLVEIRNDAYSFPANVKMNYALIGNHYGLSDNIFKAISAQNVPAVNASICGSMKKDGFVYSNENVIPNTLLNDLDE